MEPGWRGLAERDHASHGAVAKWLTQEFAKLPCSGSNPLRASYIRQAQYDPEYDRMGHMGNPEFEYTEKVSEDETGHSEKELDLDIEIRAGEWQNLRRFHAFQKRSRQGKIIATYQAVSNRLNQLVPLYYKLVNQDARQSVKLLDEIKHLRIVQEILLNCLIWSREARSGSAREQDEKIRNVVPPDVWDLIN